MEAKDTIILLLIFYLALLLGHNLSFLIPSFIPAKGLWRLVPFKVSGWRSKVYENKVYPCNWVWSKIDFRT